MKVVPSLWVAVLGSFAVVAQEPTEEELRRWKQEQEASDRMRAAALENLKAGKPLIAIDWRRNASGDLEYRAAEATDAPFVPWFGKSGSEALAAAGIAGQVMWFPHHGDVLSLTHGEHHLRRLGVGSTPAELAAFVRSPWPGDARDLAILDRSVAIDLLARRGADDAAVAARKALADDPKLDAALRERAAGTKPERARLDPKSVALPERCDLVVVVDHERMFDGLFVVDLGVFTGQLSTMVVLQMLKAPQVRDVLVGQVESELVTELPFEFVRRFGNARLDHTVFAWRAPAESDPGGWMVSSAGQFSPARIVAGLTAAGIEGVRAERDGDAAKVYVDGAELVVTESIATLRTAGLVTKVDPTGGAWTSGVTGAVRIRVPSGSVLLRSATGFQGVTSYELGVSFDDPLAGNEILLAKDETSAQALASKIQRSALPSEASEFVSGLVARFAPTLRDATTRVVTVSGSEVRVRSALPLAKLPSLRVVREHMMEENLR